MISPQIQAEKSHTALRIITKNVLGILYQRLIENEHRDFKLETSHLSKDYIDLKDACLKVHKEFILALESNNITQYEKFLKEDLKKFLKDVHDRPIPEIEDLNFVTPESSTTSSRNRKYDYKIAEQLQKTRDRLRPKSAGAHWMSWTGDLCCGAQMWCCASNKVEAHRPSSDKELNIRTVQQFLKNLIGMCYKPFEKENSRSTYKEYLAIRSNMLDFQIGFQQCFMPVKESSDHIQEPAKVYEHDNLQDNGRDIFGELFLWSLLRLPDSISMSMRIWIKIKEPLAAALFAHRFLQKLAKQQQTHSFDEKRLQKYSKVFESLALELLDVYYFEEHTKDESEEHTTDQSEEHTTDQSEEHTTEREKQQWQNLSETNDIDHQFTKAERQEWTMHMLVTKSKNWGRKSPFSIAVEGSSMKFIAHDASWTKIRDIWRYGNVKEMLKGGRAKDKFTPFKIAIPRGAFAMTLICYAIFLAVHSYTLLCGFERQALQHLNEKEIFIILYVCSLCIEQLRQLIHSERGKTSYIKNLWNRIQLGAISLYFIGVILQNIPNQDLATTERCYEWARIFRALSLILFYYIILLFLCVSEMWGTFIPLVLTLTKELLKFLVILALFVSAYTIGMESMINPNHPLTNNTDNILQSILLPPYYYMFGSLGGLQQGIEIPTGNWTNATFPTSVVTDWIYPFGELLQLFITNFMCVTILIAMFNNKYDDVQKAAEMHYKFRFYQLTKEYFFHSWLPPPLSLIAVFTVLMDWPKSPFDKKEKIGSNIFIEKGDLKVKLSRNQLFECVKAVHEVEQDMTKKASEAQDISAHRYLEATWKEAWWLKEKKRCENDGAVTARSDSSRSDSSDAKRKTEDSIVTPDAVNIESTSQSMPLSQQRLEDQTKTVMDEMSQLFAGHTKSVEEMIQKLEEQIKTVKVEIRKQSVSPTDTTARDEIHQLLGQLKDIQRDTKTATRDMRQMIADQLKAADVERRRFEQEQQRRISKLDQMQQEINKQIDKTTKVVQQNDELTISTEKLEDEVIRLVKQDMV